MFLTKRHMRVVVDGDFSDSVTVDSGVPQGTVLGQLLLLCHINNLPDCVKSQVRLFTDDCLLYRTIKSQSHHLTFQKDLEALEKWASDWGMKFNLYIVFPDHTHLLFLMCLCCVVNVKNFPVLAFNVVIITIVRIYT